MSLTSVQLREKRDALQKDVDSKKVRLGVLKDKFENQRKKAKTEFGVDTPEELSVVVEKLKEDFKTKANKLEQAIKYYDAGNYAAAGSILKETEQ